MANPGYGFRINNARCDRNMSQIELAEALGTVQPNLSRWEREHACPHRRAFEAMGRVLGIDPEWLMWGGLPPQKKIKARKLNKYALPAEAFTEHKFKD